MKKLFLFTVLGLLCASFGWAQQQADQSSASSVQVGTVRGCLSGSDGNYTLAQDSSGKMFRLVGNDDQLKGRIGQEVLVTGQLTAGASAADQSDGSAKSSAGSSASGNMVQVSDVKMVSQTCNTGSEATPPSQN
jgi:hypothetical protein